MTIDLPAELAVSLREAAAAAGLTPQAFIEQKLAEAVQRDAEARAPKPDSGEILRLWLVEGDAEIATKH
ncbi:MAG: hypothetical protein SGJ23_10315 [Alphaproteobacteria bacterium]|nr:hypothetical protein [Alphaproteobacteria bacterium]